jgi:hypothetical protein
MIFSCSENKNLPDEKPVARFLDNYIYWSDLADLLVDAKTKEDTFTIVTNYINKWAKKKVLLDIALKNLPSEQLDVSKEVEEYKNSLLTYRYQQAYVAEKLDTSVSEKEIVDYYNSNKNELILSENIVKAFLIQFSRNFNQLNVVKKIIKSNNPNDIKTLETICNKNAYQCNDFQNEWISFNKILTLLPTTINNQQDFLKNNNLIECKDSNFVYILHIKEYKLIGDLMPKEWAIKNIIIPNILMKRKLKLLEELEEKSLKDYINSNKVEFFYP